jgi:CheY-like chemotaxis protein
MTPPCRLLLIEDDDNEAVAIERACCPDPAAVAFDAVTNGLQAEEFLRDGEYDLIICDLALPVDERLLKPDTTEGIRLFELIRGQSEGTPVIILSGHADFHMMQRFFEANRDADLYGTRTDEPLVRFFAKEDLPDCVDAVRTHIAKTAVLDQLLVEKPDVLTLSLSEERALRIYARRTGAANATVETLDGGLSDAKTLKVSMIDAAGDRTGTVVAKLGHLANVVQEAGRYERLAARLPVGLGAHVLYVVRAGAGRRGALIYQLADEHTSSLFGLLASRDSGATTATERLRQRLTDWVATAPTAVRPLTALRRPLISDLDLGQSGIPFPNERDIEITVRESMAHADLHGLNVLVTPQHDPTLIDYGEVRRANAALDPITLELSVVYHPAIGGKLDGWPTEEQCRNWEDLENYLEGCPVRDFISTCRSWAVEVSASREELLATAYAYSLRQVKYQNPSLPLALAVAEGALEALQALK